MFHLGTPAWEIVVRSAAVYAAMLIGMRVTGKRQMGQLTIFDLIVLLLIANAVQNAMVGPDSSLLGGIIAGATLLVVNAGVSFVRLRSGRARRLIEGEPSVLVLHGKVIPENLHREGIDEETLQAALREHGIENLLDAETVVLEIDGSISVVTTEGTAKRSRRRVKFIKHQ